MPTELTIKRLAATLVQTRSGREAGYYVVVFFACAGSIREKCLKGTCFVERWQREQDSNGKLGAWLHVYIEGEKIEVDVDLGTAFMDMYSKCRSTESTLSVFHKMLEKDVLAWNTIILGLVACGEGVKVLYYFKEMKMRKVKPDAIALVGVLAV
ncbi:tetratricopeptide repeat (TPR)-like superfamily protein [Actinidia rufa]|uniref:Tetratricopeptide repeat (TPR)-like superfamily protein n=1 Tax=Actinidia rufa TaxID=165716 RepID=A0A7J0FHY3_9ERIC|nr:tetratricopeptide repeat (TPR)-like superfamily protein [Actinidia rufa]